MLMFFFCFFLEIMIVILWAHPISSLWLPKHAHAIRVFFTFSITTSIWRPELVGSIVFFFCFIGTAMFFFTLAIDTSSRQYEHSNLNILLWLFEKTLSCQEKQSTDYLTWQSFFFLKKVCRCKWGLIVKLLLLLLFFLFLFIFLTNISLLHLLVQSQIRTPQRTVLARRKSLIWKSLLRSLDHSKRNGHVASFGASPSVTYSASDSTIQYGVTAILQPTTIATWEK